MKNLIVIFYVFVSLQVTAQSFEGTVTWTVKPADGGARSTALNMKVRNGSLITTVQGGMMNGVEMWYSDNNKKVMRVMRAQKMYVVMPAEALSAADKATEFGPFVRSTETVSILGYACSKYTGEVKEQGKSTKVTIWATTQLKDDSKVLSRQLSPFGTPKLPAEVQGIPLKIEKAGEVQEVTEIKAAKLNEADFKVPSDFTQMGK